MPAHKAATPERKLRGRQCEPSPGPESQRASRTSAIVHYSAPVVNIRRRSRLVPASFLSLIGFAVCYLAGHVLAAITGWHFVVAVGVGFGIWWIAACVVAFFVTGAVRHD